jgi:dolichol kinase
MNKILFLSSVITSILVVAAAVGAVATINTCGVNETATVESIQLMNFKNNDTFVIGLFMSLLGGFAIGVTLLNLGRERKKESEARK